MDHPKRAALYTATENTDDQLAALAQIASMRGWRVVATVAGQPISTGYPRSDRPGLDALLAGAARHEFDILVVLSLDQLGDSLRQVIDSVNRLRGHGVHLYVHEAPVDTTSPAGSAVLTVFAALAECERTLIRHRAKVSLDRARRSGVRLGRPSNANPAVRAAIVALHERGVSVRQIARQLKVGNRTIYGALEAAQDLGAPTGPRTSDNGFGTPPRALEQARTRTPT